MAVFSVFVALKWGDWRNWKKYLPTIQYFIGSDMLYKLLTWNFPLWTYPHPPNILPNHLTTSLFIMFVVYPSTMFMYLYHYPEGKSVTKRILYMLMWVGIWAVWELGMNTLGNCVYRHGWTYAWSIGFLCVMIPMLRLHHIRPLFAYALSVPTIIFLLIWFHVPVFK